MPGTASDQDAYYLYFVNEKTFQFVGLQVELRIGLMLYVELYNLVAENINCCVSS